MKVETPQILWNSEGDKGKNAPLYSIALLESGVSDGLSADNYGHILVTAGNTNVINLWKVCFNKEESATGGMFHKSHKPWNKIDYVTSLSRHELPVNSVAFSPDGLHLATAGEAGNIVVWSVPVSKRGNGNGRHFWSTISKESDLLVRIVSTHCEGVCDISWSADSKRFVVGTIDSNVLIFEDKHFSTNRCNPETHQKESEWQSVFRNGEHSSFVQGVAYDPLGVYIASMGSDRTVRVFPRKTPPKSKKKVLRPANAPRTVTPPLEHQRMVSRLLTESKVEIGKTKRIKQRSVTIDEIGTQARQRLFADESTCESFFRRLSWTTDGAFLVTPAALWHSDHEHANVSPSFSTYLFARHRFDEPVKVLSGLEKVSPQLLKTFSHTFVSSTFSYCLCPRYFLQPSVVVRPNPVLFQLPESSSKQESKENHHPSGEKDQRPGYLPYRSIFAVLTLDSVLIYDTHHSSPLSIVRGLHYTGLTDCCWSSDGHTLMVCSTDGYVSIINFSQHELGKVYEVPSEPIMEVEVPKEPPVTTTINIPPCPPGQAAVIEERPAKKTRITPTLVTAAATPSDPLVENANSAKRSLCAETESVGAAVTKLSLGTPSEEKPKKKKRIQPLLISSN